jgi:hypothetical protein
MSSKSDYEMSEVGETKGCQCQTCRTQRLYQKMHPEKHLGSVGRYYARYRDAILLSKVYARNLKGIRPHTQTLIKLIEAGFPIESAAVPKHDTSLDATRPFESISTFLTAVAS